jgi:hypothetical protein
MNTFIDESKYFLLCNKCDELLLQNDKRFKYINWLHIIRAHPIFLINYSILFSTNQQYLIVLILTFLKYIFFGGIKFFHGIYRYYLLKECISVSNNSFDSVFISHLLNKEFLNKSDDFYFYDLPKYYQKENKRSLIIYINYIGDNAKNLENLFLDKTISRLVLPRYVSISDELKIRMELIKLALNLLFSNPKSKIERRIKYKSIVECFSPATFFNMRLSVQLNKIFKRIKGLNYIFTTYEGHAWERISFSLARSIFEKIKCIGYQHALVFKFQHAISRSLGLLFEPDYILCSGKDSLKKLSTNSNSNLINFGTKRIDEASENLIINKEHRGNNKTFLILSEGDLIECLPLVDISLILAKKNPHKDFIIRFHPMTSLVKIYKKRPELSKPPKNLFISNLKLEDDFFRSDFAIYRGSTTIIKAIQYKLIPIYYELENEISIDPLIEYKEFKPNLRIKDNLDSILTKTNEENNKSREFFKNLSCNFFTPLDYSSIKHL